MLRFLTCFLLLTSAIVQGDPIEYDLINYCNSDDFIEVSTSALLTLSVDQWHGDFGNECTVQVKTDLNPLDAYSNRVRMEIQESNVPCSFETGDSYLQLFEGQTSGGVALSTQLCGYVYSDQKMYVTQSDDTMTIVIKHNDYSLISLKLLATATSYWYADGNFVCDNSYDVDMTVQCDSDNNCGDWSDESSSLCDPLGWPLKIGVIAGGCVIGVVSFVVILALVIGRRR